MRQRPSQLGPKVGGIARLDQQAVVHVDHQIQCCAQATGNDGRAHRERLDDDQAEGLVPDAREHQGDAASHLGKHVCSGLLPQHAHGAALRELPRRRTAADNADTARWQRGRRIGKNLHTFFWRKPADKQHPVAVAGGHITVCSKVRLDHDLPGGQPAFDELGAAEVVQRDVAVHLVLPGAQAAVQHQHAGQHARGRA